MSILAYWREVLIALLAGSCFFAIRSCNQAYDKIVQIQTEDRALADQAKHEADEQKRKDKEDYDHAQNDFKAQIDKLAADHRVASMQCLRKPETRSRSVSPAANTAAGITTEVPGAIPPTTTFDPGPAIDQLTRECDALAVAHNELIDWVMATR